MAQDVVVEKRGKATWIRLNRPERKNSFDEPMAGAIAEAVRDAAGSNVIVLTGSGDSFSAGGYVKNLAEADPLAIRRLMYGSLQLVDAIRRSPRPVIAAVNGVAVGGGNELVVACDFAIAAESATLGQVGPRVGSAPVIGGTNMLSMSVGEKRGKEISMLCRRYTAAEAHEMGWVNAVAPDEELEATVDAWCEEIYALSPRYLEIAKVSSNAWWNAIRDSFESGLGMLMQASGSPDMLEGATAFMEKRKPRFEQPGEDSEGEA
jgi:2-ketocyclohexanecarboxyl-CoA hydrolase